MTKEEALEINSVLSLPGWAHIKKIAEEMIREDREEVFEIMASRPDQLTGKTAIRHAARAKAIMDFSESVQDTQKILAPNQKGWRSK